MFRLLLPLLLLGPLLPLHTAHADWRIVRCESRNYDYNQCRMPIGEGRVRIQRQLSQQPCDYRRTWGYDTNGIWVNQGCRAEFRVQSRDIGPDLRPRPPVYGNRPNSNRRLVTCPQGGYFPSDHIDQATCRISSGRRVELHRQLSHSPCIHQGTWGTRGNRIWVREGCRAEFRVD